MSELSDSKSKIMTESAVQNNHQDERVLISQKKMKRRRRCKIAIGLLLLLLIILVAVALILALTLFKPKEPRIQLLSASLEGIAPQVTLPAIDIQLNVTLDLKILVDNRNRASFKHQEGKSILLYKGKEVGETYIYPGLIPARGSATLPSRLTLEVDKFASNVNSLLRDLLGGQLSIETVTRIPGRVSFLGFIKKHVVAVSNCQFIVAVPDMKIRSQVCKNKTKL